MKGMIEEQNGAMWSDIPAVDTGLTIRNKVQSFNQHPHWTMDVLEDGCIHSVGAVNDSLTETTVQIYSNIIK